MSIQTELTRLTNAKAAIRTAIEGKGVTVPSGTLLDGMAALIDAIEAGGGCTITSGSFTPASDPTYGYTITHGLGKIPEIFVCNISEGIEQSGHSGYYLYGIYSNSLNVNKSSNFYNSVVGVYSRAFNNITETTIHAMNTNIFTTKTYSWIAVG